MVCYRCNGTGYVAAYAHIEGGACYGCEGTGRRVNRAEAHARRVAKALAARPMKSLGFASTADAAGVTLSTVNALCARSFEMWLTRNGFYAKAEGKDVFVPVPLQTR
jgi:hypothetical protein